MYVITTPATMLAIADEEPNETSTPRKIEIPRNAGVCDPGRYGKTTTAPNTITKNRTILYVGIAQSRWKPGSARVPVSRPVNKKWTSLRR